MNFYKLSLIILAISIPWFGVSFFHIGIPNVGYLVGLLLLLLHSFYTKKLKLNIKNFEIIFLYFIILLLTSLISYSAISSAVEVVGFFIIFIYLLIYDFKRCDINLFFKYTFFSAFIRSVLELSYAFTHMELWAGKYIHFMRFSVSHFGGDPNNLALILSAILMYWFVNSRNKYYYVLSLPIIFHILMLLSRGAFLAIFLSLFIYYIIMKKKFFYIIYIFSFFLISLTVLYYLYENNLFVFDFKSLSGHDTSAQSRIHYWIQVFDEMNLKSFFIGWGPRSYVDVYGHWIHNSYIGRFSDLGIVGFFLFLTIIIITNVIYFKKRDVVFVSFCILSIGAFFVDFYQNALLWFLIGYSLKNSYIFKRKVGCYENKNSLY